MNECLKVAVSALGLILLGDNMSVKGSPST